MKTGGKPVYRYLYARPRPRFLGNAGRAPALPARAHGRRRTAPRGAVAFRRDPVRHGQHLDLDQRYAWEPADQKVSEDHAGVFREFHQDRQSQRLRPAELAGVPAPTSYQRMRVDVDSHAEPEPHRDRYLALDAIYAKP